MPQPLSKKLSNNSYTISTEALERYPQLAGLTMQCIAAISSADRNRGLILSCMLGADAHIALRMYESLVGESAKKAAFDAAAKQALTSEEHNVFQRLQEKNKAAFKERNRFAHNLWGWCEDLPDALLMIPASLSLDWVTSETSAHASGLAMLTDPSKVMVYTEGDFLKWRERMKQAERQYEQFRAYLFHKSFKDKTPQISDDQFGGDIRRVLDATWYREWTLLKKELGLEA